MGANARESVPQPRRRRPRSTAQAPTPAPRDPAGSGAGWALGDVAVRPPRQAATSSAAGAPPGAAAGNPPAAVVVTLVDNSSLGFKNYDDTTKAALRAAVESELSFLGAHGLPVRVEIGGGPAATAAGNALHIDVHLVEPGIAEDRLSSMLRSSGVTVDPRVVKTMQRELAAQHGQRYGSPGAPGGVFVPVGPIYSDVGGQGLFGDDAAVAEAHRTMGVALSRLVLHELGHELGLGHTKDRRHRETISDPGHIMDFQQPVSTSATVEELNKVTFTPNERKDLEANVQRRRRAQP